MPWSTQSHTLHVYIDTNGGNNFTLMGTQQLLSVPYALSAKEASALSTSAQINVNQLASSGASNNQVLSFNGTNWVPGDPLILPYSANNNGSISFYINNTLNGGQAIYGRASGNHSNSIGVRGEAMGTNGIGVYGNANSSVAIGVQGYNGNGVAIKGITAGSSASIPAVWGDCLGNSGIGVQGTSDAASGIGVYGESLNGTGIKGYSNNTGSVAVFGSSLAGTGVKAFSVSGKALEVTGNVSISGGTTNPDDGTVLCGDASGNAVWKKRNVGFMAFVPIGTNQTIAVGTNTVFTLTEQYDVDGNFNPSSASTDPNTFIAPVSGLYHFDASARIFLGSFNWNITTAFLGFQVNGALQPYHIEYSNQSINEAGSSKVFIRCSRDIMLNAGDKVRVVGNQYNFGDLSATLSGKLFSGHLVFAN